MKRIFTLFILILVFGIASPLMAATTHVNGSPGGAGTDANAIHDNIANEISSIASKETPTTSDILIIEDAAASNVKKKITIGDLPSSTGDVMGPGTNTDGYIPLWYGADSKTLQNGVELSTDGTMSGNSDSAVPTEKAVKTYVDGAVHTQGTDQYLDQGGVNEVTASNAKDAVDKKHEQNKDQYVDYGGTSETSAPDIKDAVDKKHTQGTDTGTTAGSFLIENAARIKHYSGVLHIRNAADDDFLDVYAKSFNTGQSATQAGYFRLFELSGNGTSYWGWQANDSIASILTFVYQNTLPGDNYFQGWMTPSGNVSQGKWLMFGSDHSISGGGEVTVVPSSVTEAGKIEIATSSETNGTDNTRALSPEALRGSNYGAREICWSLFDSDTAVSAGDGKKAYTVPSIYNGWDIVDVIASVHTNGSSGTTDVQIRRRRAGSDVDVLSTKITKENEYFASDEVINTSNDDLQTGDQLYPDVDAARTGDYGLSVTVVVRLPGA